MECYLKKNNLGTLEDYIKHTKDWSVLDGVLSFDFDNKEITCFANIDAESVFYESEYDGIYSYTGFEFIAQACGVYYGLESRLVYNRPPKFGFILRVNNLECTEMLIPSGKTAIVSVKESLRDGVFAYFDGQISVDDRLIVKATLMLMEADSAQNNNFSAL
ncbi:thioester dehydrase [Treponema medium]|mgnify:FL=1|uniref:Uncharacterized protein n=2 Tax=Treponema medium TaxID=58231 RepID=A0AA87NMU0_TREMD|nr:hypothetical protein [Treponema medium]EPF29439.1 hypothetical protein HMPREF9195_00725 [Treponema medium ATCC 700293]QSH96872.1 thioester dehydrase [Treponema medium]